MSLTRTLLLRMPAATALVACLGLAAAGAACADVRSVAPDGRDSGDCAASPCATFEYAYGQSRDGDVVHVRAGAYGDQQVPDGAKVVTFDGDRGAVVRTLVNFADDVVFDGVDVDADFAKATGFENRGASRVTFRNASIGEVTDGMGALVSGERFTFDNVVFHDVRSTSSEVHNECVYAIGVPGMTVRNSHFRACATMDLFFTYGDWWDPPPPAYGDVTLENNVFEHSTDVAPGSWNHYSLYIAGTGPGGGRLDGWVVRHNTFETPAAVGPKQGATGSRWVGNLGAWSCVQGVVYRRNVGEACGPDDKAVKPASSTRDKPAPFGWADPSDHDFRLTRGSPAIDAGDPRDNPGRDREGAARDGRPDAGAHEFAETAPALSAPAAGDEPQTDSGVAGRRRLRSVHLRPGVVCRVPRRGCPATARLVVADGRAARLRIALRRVRPNAAPVTVRRLRVRAGRRPVRLRARGLSRGRHRVVVRAHGRDGTAFAPARLRLHVR